ncbi:unnamed protein product [Linum trigynum]|uniref:Fe2OG dioxygenase domain-containing protein n=1 Tax=Linum trigynum TaxID=586398 RepID=A0AAV2G2S1_9ROSI
MAAADPISAGERDLAQVLAASCAEPPAAYLQNEVMAGVADGTLPVIDVPQVDISLLSSPCPATSKAEAQKLGSALSTYGCCLAVNHGTTSAFLDSVRDVLNDFYRLPLEEKTRHARPFGNWEGYGFDEIPDNYGSLDWSDRLMIMISPEEHKKMQYWPEAKPPNFRRIVEEWASKLEVLLEKVLKGMATSLDLDEKSFVEEMGEPRIVARFNLYPKCSRPDRVLGLNSHTDGSAVTFLLQDKEVEGFQLLLKDGQWVRVPVTPTDALLIKMGDQGEIISNGEFKAPLHRGALNTQRARTSIAVFCIPEAAKEIGPAKGLVDETRPAKYKKITDYERDYLQESNHRTLIDSLKL